ncbi:MAG: enoyl-CoA hydratase/isomerase family protein [Nostocoides sp.]
MITYEVRDNVAWALLDRAEKLNAMDRGFWGELCEVSQWAGSDAGVRALVFHGAGSCFSVGGDISTFEGMDDASSRRQFSQECLDALRMVEEIPKPTIAAVHGYAFGGGCELTMVCDIVVADQTAVFATPEAAVGLFPGLGVVRGRAHTGLHWMKYLAFTGERISAQDARTAGLVTVLTEEGAHRAEAERLAQLIAAKAPLALAAAKNILQRGHEDGYAWSVEAIAMLHGTADQREGVSAFFERRTPNFHGT